MGIAAQHMMAATQRVYDPSSNWDAADQPLGLPTPKEYIAEAIRTVPLAEQEIKAFIDGLGFDVDLIGPCVKGEKRSNQKLYDENSSARGDAGRIRDYLRLTISPQTVEELMQVIEALEQHPNTVAWKNRFYEPEKSTGMRDYKALWLVGDMLMEVKVEFAPMEAAYEFTKNLRSAERVLLDFRSNAWTVCASTKDGPENRKRLNIMVSQAEDTAQSMRGLRKDVHDIAAENLGLNALLNPALQHQHQAARSEDVAQHVSEMRSTSFGKRMLKGLCPEAILGVASGVPTSVGARHQSGTPALSIH